MIILLFGLLLLFHRHVKLISALNTHFRSNSIISVCDQEWQRPNVPLASSLPRNSSFAWYAFVWAGEITLKDRSCVSCTEMSQISNVNSTGRAAHLALKTPSCGSFARSPVHFPPFNLTVGDFLILEKCLFTVTVSHNYYVLYSYNRPVLLLLLLLLHNNNNHHHHHHHHHMMRNINNHNKYNHPLLPSW